jgi:hypothetical protein
VEVLAKGIRRQRAVELGPCSLGVEYVRRGKSPFSGVVELWLKLGKALWVLGEDDRGVDLGGGWLERVGLSGRLTEAVAGRVELVGDGNGLEEGRH